MHPSQTMLEYSKSGRTYEIYIWFNALLEKSYFSFLIIPIILEAELNIDSMCLLMYMYVSVTVDGYSMYLYNITWNYYIYISKQWYIIIFINKMH